MNYNLPHIPIRPDKPRNKGITMVMDKGLSLRDIESLICSSAEFVDIVKLGFGTSLIANKLKKKLDLYKDAGIKTYFGGTLFEAFYIRNMFDEFCMYLNKYDMEYAEVSDGVACMKEDEKCEYIRQLSKDFTVISEVGYKNGSRTLENSEWVEKLHAEQSAGSWKLIAEGRESGTVGIFNKDGSANSELIEAISTAINIDDMLWEAPKKTQQVWFIKHFGAEVNLGNISPQEVLPLETLRRGLRGDTLLDFLS